MSKSRQSTAQRISSANESEKSQMNPKLPKDFATLSESVDKSEQRVRPILDFQDMAPAPSQTYYQIAVYPYKSREKKRVEKKASINRSPSPLSKALPELTHEKLERGCVIIREWPRKRFSQGWSRAAASNPSEIVLELEDFVKGEMASHITSIFGAQRYDQLVKAAESQVQIKKKD